MRRTRPRLWLGALAGAAFVALPAGAGASIAPPTGPVPATAHHAGSPVANTGACARRSPSRLRLKRLPGTAARLSWHAPGAGSASGALAYRVFRAGRTVGQTARPSMVLAVTPGRRTTFSVQARYANGALKCSAKLTETVPGAQAGRRPRTEGPHANGRRRDASAGAGPTAGTRRSPATASCSTAPSSARRTRCTTR